MIGGYNFSHVDAFDFHSSMLVDRTRTEAFLRATLATVRPGDVVVDIGTGTGVLAMFAAIAGARRVYAIERDPVIELAREVAEVNGYADRIQFIRGESTEVELPERGDVLLTETIGNAGFDEGILAWVTDAQQRLLKPGAHIVPQRLDLCATLLELPLDAAELECLAVPLYSLDFSPLRTVAVNSLVWEDLSPVSVLGEPAIVASVPLQEPPGAIDATVDVAARRDGTVHAIGLWFDAELAKGVELTNAPPTPAPSWHQGILMLDEPVAVSAGERRSIRLHVAGDGSEWGWQIVAHGRMQSTVSGRLPLPSATP